jgi:hypothetical protein
MNTLSTSTTQVSSSIAPHLLDAIVAARVSVGDGLTDDEFTRLVRQTGSPNEAGFAFLSYSDGVVTLTVPEQDLARWHPEKGWIAAEKERIGSAIAAKYGLSLHEPPDRGSSYLYPRRGSPKLHHHLELCNQQDTIIVAHPQYLKIRLFGARSGMLTPGRPQVSLVFEPELLQELSALYQA